MDWHRLFRTVKEDIYKAAKEYPTSSTTEKSLRRHRVDIAIQFIDEILLTKVPEMYRTLFTKLKWEASQFKIEMLKKPNPSSSYIFPLDNPPKKQVNRNSADKNKKVSVHFSSEIGQKNLNFHSNYDNIWGEVVGLEGAKQTLDEAIFLPMKYPQFFEGNAEPWNAVLLYGPPGTGKTFLAQVCAKRSEFSFIATSAADLMSKFVGESERNLKSLFREAEEKSPCILFFDEIDSIGGQRGEDSESARRVKNELFVQMQGMVKRKQRVVVLAATNLPWTLDAALRRRFERRIYIPLPTLSDREKMLKLKMNSVEHELKDKDFHQAAKATEGFSGTDIELLARDAAFGPLRSAQSATNFSYNKQTGKYLPSQGSWLFGWAKGDKKSIDNIPFNKLQLLPVSQSDLKAAIANARASVSRGDLKEYEIWTKDFGMTST